MSDPRSRQVGGNHYQSLKAQPWDVLPEWLEGWSPWQAYLVGNIIKYLCRAPRKGARLDDARKAQHYLEELIRNLEDEPQPGTATVVPKDALREYAARQNAALRDAACRNSDPIDPRKLSTNGFP